MRRRDFLGAAGLACLSVWTGTEIEHRRRPGQYLALGDSITGGKPGATSYAEMIRAHPSELRLRSVMVHPMPGKTTAQALRIMLGDTFLAKYQLSTVMLGTNDHVTPRGRRLPLISLEEYDRHLSKITESLLGCSQKVALLTPPFVRTNATTSEARLKTYVDVMKSVAARHRVTLVDVHQLTGELCHWSDREWQGMTLQSEGVHPVTSVHSAIRSLLVRSL